MEKRRTDRLSMCRFQDIFESKLEDFSSCSSIEHIDIKCLDDSRRRSQTFDVSVARDARRACLLDERAVMGDTFFPQNIDFRRRASTNPEVRRPTIIDRKPIVRNTDKIGVTQLIRGNHLGSEQPRSADKKDDTRKEKPVKYLYRYGYDDSRPRAHTFDVIADKNANSPNSANPPFRSRALTNPEMRRSTFLKTKSKRHQGLIVHRVGKLEDTWEDNESSDGIGEGQLQRSSSGSLIKPSLQKMFLPFIHCKSPSKTVH